MTPPQIRLLLECGGTSAEADGCLRFRLVPTPDSPDVYLREVRRVRRRLQ